MALEKSNLNINFAQGLDTKTDPFQVSPGKMLSLQNTVFTKQGLLQKRNGFSQLSVLPDTSNTFVTTFSEDPVAIGSSLYSYVAGTNTWLNKGGLAPVKLDTISLVKTGTNQVQVDAATASNGLTCVVYSDSVPTTGGLNTVYKYAVIDSGTGATIVSSTTITSSGGVIGTSPRVYVLGQYFVMLFGSTISANPRIQYVAVSVNNPTVVVAATDVLTGITLSSAPDFDAVVVNNNLYIAAINNSSATLKLTYMDSTLATHNVITFGSQAAIGFSLCADTTGPTAIIYVFWYRAAPSSIRMAAFDHALATLTSPQTIFIAPDTIQNLTSVAQNGSATVFAEIYNYYPFAGGTTRTDYIMKVSVTSAGVYTSDSVVARSVGLASKAFLFKGTPYFLATYQSNYQSTYFLIDGSGNIIAKLAYTNAGGYLTTGLPGVTLSGNTVSIPYLYKSMLIPVNKTQGVADVGGVFAQKSINQATFTFTTDDLTTSELGNNLHISGGFLWAYDGAKPVEQGFHLYPDSVTVTTTSGSGAVTAQQYFYQAVYEWADAQGNLMRSAPSLPVTVTASGSVSTNTIYVPTLRVTAKTNNPIKIVLYRWSTAQQTYYQATSVTTPTLNDTTVDYVTITDTQADSSLIGNSILYTTGGVVENTGAPATDVMTIFKSRLFIVDSEDKNLLWFSKEVWDGVPVEMSDLFTQYVAPTIGAQGNTGPITALAAMDDKLIIFKKNAVYYMTGDGPNDLGSGSSFSEPVFITSTVGCSRQNSIVFIPQGLLFQSDKGIWMLGRDLNTTYIGAPVENFNSSKVLSATNIPGTNQVRFTLDSGVTIMYDYFFGQWGTFTNIPALSSTLYQNLHTYIDSFGRVFQESPGQYLDGSNPVLMSFTTGWMNLAGLQGYERAYWIYLLGTYLTPHFLKVSLAYDYNPYATQVSTIRPDNFSPAYGGGLYGGTSQYGGETNLEQWKVFLERQKCESFQISVQEAYDPSFGVPAGAGLTLSGINLIYGIKKGYSKLRKGAARQVG